MRIKSFRTNDVDLYFAKEDNVFLLNSRYKKTFFYSIKNLFRLDDEDRFAILTLDDINSNVKENIYMECEQGDSLYSVSIMQKANDKSNTYGQKGKEIIFTDLGKRTVGNTDEKDCFFFFPEYLFYGCYRMISCFYGVKNKYYTQEVLNYWAAKGDKATQSVLKKIVTDFSKIIIDNYGVNFIKDPWGDVTFGIYDETPTEREEQFSVIDFLTANKLTDMLVNSFKKTEGPPLFIINQLANKSEKIIADTIETLRKIGRQTFIFEDKQTKRISDLCDKEIN